MKRLPRKQIATKFKNGYSTFTLAVMYSHYFPRMNWTAKERAIIDIIRQYMREQDKR